VSSITSRSLVDEILRSWFYRRTTEGFAAWRNLRKSREQSAEVDRWLGGRDSNPDRQIQNLQSYHWTTSQRIQPQYNKAFGSPKTHLAITFSDQGMRNTRRQKPCFFARRGVLRGQAWNCRESLPFRTARGAWLRPVCIPCGFSAGNDTWTVLIEAVALGPAPTSRASTMKRLGAEPT
jgi:hypothetical protein